jgi:hypothetical protein
MWSPEVLNKGLHDIPTTPITATPKEEDYWQNPNAYINNSEGDTEMHTIMMAIQNLQIHTDQCNKDQLLQAYSQIVRSDPQATIWRIILTAQLRRLTPEDKVYISRWRLMKVKVLTKVAQAQDESSALVDCGATENFMDLRYAQRLGLPVQELSRPQKLFNVDWTENKSGELKYYSDLSLQIGPSWVKHRFYLSNLGNNSIILGYL